MDAHVASRPRQREPIATFLVACVMGVVVLGGYAVAGSLAEPAGPPVDVGDAIRIQPLSGWEVATRFDRPTGVRLTRGGGNLDVVTVPYRGRASSLAQQYVDRALEGEAQQLSVSRDLERVVLASGLAGVRITYVGLFGKAQAPIEGEVTAVVSPSGLGAIFDAWGTEGLLRYIVDDARTMIERAEVA